MDVRARKTVLNTSEAVFTHPCSHSVSTDAISVSLMLLQHVHNRPAWTCGCAGRAAHQALPHLFQSP